MSRRYIEDPVEREKLEKEEKCYNRIMAEGKHDECGYIVGPPDNMTDEEEALYKKLKKEFNGRIPWLV